MSNPLRKLFDQNKLHQENTSDVKVLISLTESPKESDLETLKEIGLNVSSIKGNKLTGEISSNSLAKLKEQAIVSEVEKSVELKPTNSLLAKQSSPKKSDP